MKIYCLIAAACLVAMGCGHSSNFTDTTPTQVHTSKTDNGLWTTTGETRTEITHSEYEACLDRNRGYPDAETECAYWIQAGRPGQMPKYYMGTGWYPTYGSYGYPGYGVRRYVTPGSLVYGY